MYRPIRRLTNKNIVEIFQYFDFTTDARLRIYGDIDWETPKVRFRTTFDRSGRNLQSRITLMHELLHVFYYFIL